MTDLRDAARQALEALEDHAKQYPHMQKGYTVDAITALKAALAEEALQRLTDANQEIEAVLEQPTRAQKMRDAGYTRRPTLREIAALEQPEQDVPETDCGNMQVEWADIPKEFNNWWDADRLTQTNPFREDSPAYWAWEGWQARAALEQPEQELVAWRWKAMVNGDFVSNWVLTHSEPPPYALESHPLYTHPPRREWRGLTDEEIRVLVRQTLRLVEANGGEEDVEFYRAIEAALKERNV